MKTWAGSQHSHAPLTNESSPIPDAHMSSTLQQTQSMRITAWGRVLIITIISMMVLQLVRVAQLKVAPEARLLETVGTPISSRDEITRRGDVLDRRGRMAATSTLGYRLFVDPVQVSDLSTIAVDLANLLGTDPVPIDQAIIPRSDRRYVVIEHLLEDWQVEAIRAARLRGVGLEPRLVRHYPQGDLAAHIIGMVGFEHSGLGGLEHVHNSQLTSLPGRLTYLRAANRQALWIEPTGYRPGQSGGQLQLSIDLVIQEIADRHLRDAVHRLNAGGGRIVVLDSRTGEILAMTDILNPREGWKEQTEDPIRKTNPALGRNRCVTDPYEPGSTFKPFVWAAATELGFADPDEVLKTPPPGVVYRTSRGRRIRDAFPYAEATWHETLVRSLNSGMAIVAERMSQRELREAVLRFGFGSPTRSGLPGETAGILTSPRNWNHYTQTSVPMGQEIAVTPLQMVRAFSVFARDGTLPPIRSTAISADEMHIEVTQQVLSIETVMLARDAMLDAATRNQSKTYQIFGKSGTAQLPRRDGRGYHENRYVSSFIAGAPFDDPHIVVLCVIDDPDKKIGHFGGTIAGPVVRDVIDETLTYLGVRPCKIEQP
jgi:cell division protein FtsI (penicillin-binding protein 3)